MKTTAAQRAAIKANNEYLAAVAQWHATERDTRADGLAEFRGALVHIKRTAMAAWDRLIVASAPLSANERTALTWAIHSEEYSPARLT